MRWVVSRPAAVACATVAWAAACGGYGDPADPAGREPEPTASVARVEVVAARDTIRIGDAVAFVVTAFDDRGTVLAGRSATWTSADESVAILTSPGLARAVRRGTAIISATVDGVSGSASVTVARFVEPPLSGTIFIDPDIITASDPTALVGVTAAGRGSRTMFDRRVPGWITVEAFLFDAVFDDGATVEVQVNPEFGTLSVAEIEAASYAEAIGRLPSFLRADVETVWIHRGVEPFGGGNRNILIHTGQGALYIQDGILEETLAHEAAHTSLDALHASAPGWLAAQTADSVFISGYAQDFPIREDIAESIVPYIAVRRREARISEVLRDVILGAIPHRIEYFDSLGFEWSPVEGPR